MGDYVFKKVSRASCFSHYTFSVCSKSNLLLVDHDNLLTWALSACCNVYLQTACLEMGLQPKRFQHEVLITFNLNALRRMNTHTKVCEYCAIWSVKVHTYITHFQKTNNKLFKMICAGLGIRLQPKLWCQRVLCILYLIDSLESFWELIVLMSWSNQINIGSINLNINNIQSFHVSDVLFVQGRLRTIWCHCNMLPFDEICNAVYTRLHGFFKLWKVFINYLKLQSSLQKYLACRNRILS